MEDIAAAAGVTRQTVYAHFPSRDALIARPPRRRGSRNPRRHRRRPPRHRPARRGAGASSSTSCWQLLRPLPPPARPGPDPDPPAFRPRPAPRRRPPMLERLIQRGQRDRRLRPRAARQPGSPPPSSGSIRTAAEQVAAGRLTTDAGGDHAPGEHAATVRRRQRPLLGSSGSGSAYREPARYAAARHGWVIPGPGASRSIWSQSSSALGAHMRTWSAVAPGTVALSDRLQPAYQKVLEKSGMRCRIGPGRSWQG